MQPDSRLNENGHLDFRVMIRGLGLGLFSEHSFLNPPTLPPISSWVVGAMVSSLPRVRTVVGSSKNKVTKLLIPPAMSLKTSRITISYDCKAAM